MADGRFAQRTRELGLDLPRGVDPLASVSHALLVADYAHRGQTRKYTGEPYVCHPISVARTVRDVYPQPDAVCAALLHDVVEDTGCTSTDLTDTRLRLGPNVPRLVAQLTDVSTSVDGNRRARKAIDRRHLAAAEPVAKLVKLGDLLDNAASIVANDPAFARVYLEEKRLILTESLTLPTGLNEPLRRAYLVLQARAWRQLESGEGALEKLPRGAFKRRRGAPPRTPSVP